MKKSVLILTVITAGLLFGIRALQTAQEIIKEEKTAKTLQNTKDVTLIINNDKSFKITHFFWTPTETAKGLSGVKPEDFADTDIALFLNSKHTFDSKEEPKPISFWMPNTLFPLTLIFIDQYGLVIGVENLDNFPEKATEENKFDIPRTSSYAAKYILEVKQTSPIVEIIQVGDYIDLKGLDISVDN